MITGGDQRLPFQKKAANFRPVLIALVVFWSLIVLGIIDFLN